MMSSKAVSEAKANHQQFEGSSRPLFLSEEGDEVQEDFTCSADSGWGSSVLIQSVSDDGPRFLSRNKLYKNTTTTGVASTLTTWTSVICCCVRPRNLSLRIQLILSFGTVTVLSVIFIMITSILTARTAGDNFLYGSLSQVQAQWNGRIGNLTMSLAEAVEQRIESLDGAILLTAEVTRDRFRGYPNAPGYVEDRSVPFIDIFTQERVYPIQGRPLPFEWELDLNASSSNTPNEFFVGNRKEWYESEIGLNMIDPVFYSKGVCGHSQDPSEVASLSDCIASKNGNNIFDTSRITSPAALIIHKRASDYAAPLLRAVYEYHNDIQYIGIHFVAEGSGASVVYPGRVRNGTIRHVSMGCEWLLEPNPLKPTQSIGSPAMIQRCNSEGQVLRATHHNPVETDWFREHALDPRRLHITGPHQEPYSENRYVVTLGRAVYDDMTNELIGSVRVDIPWERMNRILADVGWFGATLAVLRWDNGRLIAASPSPSATSGNITNMTVADHEPLKADWRLFEAAKADFLEKYHRDQASSDPTVWSVGQDRLVVYVTFCPFPRPPDEYDPTYVPDFAVLATIDETSAEGVRERVIDNMEGIVNDLRMQILVGCLVGMVLVLVIVYVTALCITLPLQWMHSAGSQILSSYGSSQKPYIDGHFVPWVHHFTPRTEVSELADEFQLMIKQFAGGGTAKLFKRQLSEVKNPFSLQQHFGTLYTKRDHPRNDDDSSRLAQFDTGHDQLFHPKSDQAKTAESVDLWQNRGRNVVNSGNLHPNQITNDRRSGANRRTVVRLRMFWWIAGSIALPLLCTLFAVSAYVIWRITITFPEQNKSLGDHYGVYERLALVLMPNFRVPFLTEILSTQLQNLYLFNRVAGWFYFGALDISLTFTMIDTAAEQCKSYAQNTTCPAIPDNVCDCGWKDGSGSSCQNYAQGESRLFQHPFFEGLNEDVLPNGDRNETTYPQVATSPASTSFWNNASSLAGFNNGQSTSRTSTPYDRVRTLSALSFVQIPLYNYGKHSRRAMRVGGIQIGFESDGMIGGYSGCDKSHARSAFFESTVDNDAAEFGPHLCPEGKYG